MKICIHINHHECRKEKIIFERSCDMMTNKGTGDISYHNWNIKNHDECHCGGTKLRYR